MNLKKFIKKEKKRKMEGEETRLQIPRGKYMD